MILRSRAIIFFLILPQFSYATQWPFVIIQDAEKNLFVSSKRRVVRSQARLKKSLATDTMQHLFSGELSLMPPQPQDSTLEALFVNAKKKCHTKIRVLLAQADNTSSIEWQFSSPQGFLIQLEGDRTKTKKISKVPAVAIKNKQGFLVCNGKCVKGALRLRPIGGSGTFNGTLYDGDFVIMPHKEKLLCVNELELEDYVTAVLRTESWPGWPLEVNKVFAIACRSYVMFKVSEARRSGRPYHVKNTNAHQTYGGKHELPMLKMAVEHTRGMVLGFKGAPILAMFDCCCGGVVPAHIADFDFSKVPYLARTYACHYCQQSSLYSWQVSYEHAVFEAIVKQHHHDMVRLCDIHGIKKDKAGLVTEVTLKGQQHTIIISGKKLYSLLKEVKSFHFDLHKKSGKIVFTGRGFGHHMGLCQWGARQMVREGWDYKSILRFYYPGAYFMYLIG